MHYFPISPPQQKRKYTVAVAVASGRSNKSGIRCMKHNGSGDRARLVVLIVVSRVLSLSPSPPHDGDMSFYQVKKWTWRGPSRKTRVRNKSPFTIERHFAIAGDELDIIAGQQDTKLGHVLHVQKMRQEETQENSNKFSSLMYLDYTSSLEKM